MADEQETGWRTVAELVETTDGGAFNIEASDEYRQLMRSLRESVRANGKGKASLTIKFEFVADSAGKTKIVADVATKHPRRPRSESIAWLGDGALVESDPRQAKLALAGVGAAIRPLAGAK